ncbi:MAG: protein kinase [Betaproteobacteria bacterium]|nr:MAG: protein kinase [Betaproteobacteria bacterium]
MQSTKLRETLGRFEIVRLLGEGAQGAVYLAYDTRLGRRVAIKTLLMRGGQDTWPEQLATLLEEARIVSQLSHPNIVTLYDTGEDQGRPYLVFEYVSGELLKKSCGKGRPIKPARAADICIQILKAIDYAHRHGVLHRDIKPGNVMITEDGTARIMDFGIAQLVGPETPSDDQFRGTPRYMAPEYITDKAYTERSELFSIGLVLHEMLTGQPAVTGENVLSIMHQIANEPIDPPSRSNPQVDENLDLLVMRALAKDLGKRFESAAQMEEALYRYLNPEPVLNEPAPDATGGTLEFLIRRMRHKSDFPALSTTISTVNQATSSEVDGVSALAKNILKDFALTNSLLRLVNTAHYGRFGGSISTISRAIVILGFNRVRSAAATLMLFEHLQNKGMANQLKDDLISAYFAGLLSRDLARSVEIDVAEEAFICSMFHDLGRLLTRFYLTEESREIDKLVQQRNISSRQASYQVLGITFEALGVGVANHWKFPSKLVDSMYSLQSNPVALPVNDSGRLQVLAELSSQVVAAIRDGPAGETDSRLKSVARRFGNALKIDHQQLLDAIRKSVEEIQRDASFLNFVPERSPFIGRVIEVCQPEVADEPLSEAALDTTSIDKTVPLEVMQHIVAAAKTSTGTTTIPLEVLETEPVASDDHVRKAILSDGIREIIDCLVGKFELNDVLEMILETMFRGFEFTRVLLFVRNPKDDTLRARFGFGEGADEILGAGLALAAGSGADIFQIAVSQGVDVFVEDIDSARIRDQIPAWYRETIGSKSACLLPVVVSGKTIGLLYGDRSKPGRLKFDRDEPSLLKTLRNQAVIAIRTSAA